MDIDRKGHYVFMGLTDGRRRESSGRHRMQRVRLAFRTVCEGDPGADCPSELVMVKPEHDD